MSEKQLQSTVAAGAYQKEWFAQLRRDVFESHRPYAILQADMPFELFQVMGLPAVSNQWWSAVIAAKRLAPKYLDAMNAMGFHDGLCRYCSLSMACTLTGSPADAPWGGLPKPALLSARLTCDCIQRVFEIWADKLGAPFVPLDAPRASELPPRWWELSRYRWDELFESHRLDFMVAQFHSLIGTLERVTESTFDVQRLRTLMEGVNQQEQYFEEVREMICNAPKAPVRMHEQVSNVMAAQWLRGGDWAIAHARAFRNEVKARVEAGVAACPSERLR